MLRDEVVRTIDQINSMANRYDENSDGYDVDQTVREFRECLQEGTVQEKRDAVRLLVDYITVVEGSGFDIHTRMPLPLPD